MATITHPVEGYDGFVAGVEFTGGVAETSDPAALAYFRRHGLGVDGPPQRSPEPLDPRDIGTDGDGVIHTGGKLRDHLLDADEHSVAAMASTPARDVVGAAAAGKVEDEGVDDTAQDGSV